MIAALWKNSTDVTTSSNNTCPDTRIYTYVHVDARVRTTKQVELMPLAKYYTSWCCCYRCQHWRWRRLNRHQWRPPVQFLADARSSTAALRNSIHWQSWLRPFDRLLSDASTVASSLAAFLVGWLSACLPACSIRQPLATPHRINILPGQMEHTNNIVRGISQISTKQRAQAASDDWRNGQQSGRARVVRTKQRTNGLLCGMNHRKRTESLFEKRTVKRL